ncbi:MAG: glycosyltransferase family 1 protein [Patescibacteria group bacterium]|nr:glycosyltransferase family 1 protein [Patescibacteria group bacterium]
MRIGIEARMMGPENTRGLGRYIQELTSAMIEVAPENDYVLIARTAGHALRDKVETVVADIPWYSWKEQRRMPDVLRSLKADVVHVPHWNVPLGYSGPLVATIHDLLLRHQPDSAKTSTRSWPVRVIKRLGFRLVLDHAIQASRKICVPTEYTRQDLINLYPSTADKITVTGEGISTLSPPSISGEAKGGSRSFLLYVGSAYPHKRLDLLIDVWETMSKLLPDLRLVIAGELDVFMQAKDAESRLRNIPRIEFLGKVSDQALANLYQNALALVFPSSFEGFGLTPLEALAAGCPVVSSDSTCLPEVLGKKGVVYFKSGSKDGMIKAVKTVVDNQDKFRNEAVAAGPELALRHSWKQAAIKTLETYRAAVLG